MVGRSKRRIGTTWWQRSIVCLLALILSGCGNAISAIIPAQPGTPGPTPVPTMGNTATCATPATPANMSAPRDANPRLILEQALPTHGTDQDYAPIRMRLTPDEHYVLIAFPDRILIYSLDRTSDSATVRERWEAEASTTGISLTDLAIVGDDRIALAWTNRVEMRALADGAIRWQHDPADASLGASSLAIDAATRTLAVGWSGRRGQWDTGGSIDLLDLDTGRQRTQVPQGGAWQLAFSQGDGSLVSVDYEATGQDSTIQYQAWLTIRARDSGAVLRREQLFTTHLLSIPTYRFSPNGDRLLAFSHGTSGLQIRDIQTGCSVVSTVPPLSTAATIADMQFALTADRLIATTTEGTIIGWSPTTDAAGWQFRAVITAASFSGATLTADGRLVFFVTPDYALRAWIVAPH